MTDRVYAIGDVHGHLEQLQIAHRRIAMDAANGSGASPVIHIGDLTDRGPNSRGVIQFLMDGMNDGADWLVIKGNHDRFFANFIRTGAVTDARLRSGLTWLSDSMGGKDTLRSYGVKKRVLEAFFTTKPPGEGTGLGLQSVLDLVRGSEGFLQIKSKPGQGTAMRIFFPLPEG